MQIHQGTLVMPRTIAPAQQQAVTKACGAAAGFAPAAVVLVSQVHGAKVRRVKQVSGWNEIGEGDALMTNESGIVLVIRTADCVPVVMTDDSRGVVAVAHAGYQGVLTGVVEATLTAMQKDYGCVLGDVRVSFGPAICAKHYDVSRATDDRVARYEALFATADGVVEREGAEVRLDLVQACRILCERVGVPTANIGTAVACTYEDAQLPSHRREGEARNRNVWTWAALQP